MKNFSDQTQIVLLKFIRKSYICLLTLYWMYNIKLTLSHSQYIVIPSFKG